MKKSVYAISCPHCAGTLDVFGGGRQITTLTCQYCGSVLDVEKEYKVLFQFKKVPIPRTPFRLGMQGKINDIAFTIIGMVAYSSEKGVTHGEDAWVDFMLHSPTHGYAWLSDENGQTVFSRRTRKLPSLNLSSLTEKERLIFDGKTYQMYERYRAYVTYVQGELTWIAHRNDSTSVVDAIAPPCGLSYERREGEIEYSISEYLDTKTVYESFGIKADAVEGFHALKPFSAPKSKVFSMVSGAFTLIALIMMMKLWIFNGGEIVQQYSFSASAAPQSIPFHIDQPYHLVELDIQTNVRNDWIYYDVEVLNAAQESVYSLGKEISYYYGSDGGESWSEGSDGATAYFKVKDSGDYLLKFNAPGYHRSVATSVRIKENVIRNTYFIALFFITLFAALIYPIQYFLYQNRLWKHLQGDDDE